MRQYAAHAGPDAEVIRATLVTFLADLTARCSPATVRVRSRALSLFCGWLVAEDAATGGASRTPCPTSAGSTPCVPTL